MTYRTYKKLLKYNAEQYKKTRNKKYARGYYKVMKLAEKDGYHL